MVTNNSDNISSAGLVKYDGSGTFSGVTVTQHDLLIGAASNGITSVAPSATSGVPVISQGAAADPAFGTAVVAGGGTGIVTTTAYGVICGGTTATGNFQNAGAGTSGQLLQSGGAAALPAYTTATYPATAGTSGNLLKSNGTNFVSSSPAGAGSSLVLIQSQSLSNQAAIIFTGLTSTYNTYFLVCSNVLCNTSSKNVLLQISTDSITYIATNYSSGLNYALFNSASITNLTSTAGFPLFENLQNTAPTSAGQFWFFNMTDGNGYPHITGQSAFNNGTNWTNAYAGGSYNAAATVTAFQVISTSGNVSGTFSLYGLREA